MPINLNLPKKPGLFVTGTDTGVGKTLIAGAIARILTDKGLKVGVFKPIATGCKHSPVRRSFSEDGSLGEGGSEIGWDGLISDDTKFLSWCANSDLSLSTITPVGYRTPAAPIVSAACDGPAIDFDRIAAAYKDICQNSDIVIVEGIGGVRVPLTEEFDLLDLAVEFALPAVIVARPNLGTINHTLMTIDCVRAACGEQACLERSRKSRTAKLKIAGVVINGYKATESTTAEDTAAETIEKYGDVEVLAVVPFDETVSIEKPNLGEVILASLAGCDWEKLVRRSPCPS
jgi:dethiobiotin synthetase